VFQLNKAKDRLHILEGLKKAIDIIDEVIDTIKKSESKADARTNLMERFGFSEKQAEYILLMRLQSLVGLEIQKISDEIEEKLRLIDELEHIIGDPEKLDEVIEKELIYMKDKY
jgi:DNA gyrase subunit A